MVEIQRDAYLHQLIERKDNGMIKVITGIRRCGKSYLLFTIFKRYLLENGIDDDHIIEIALDGIENEELRDPKVCFTYIKDAMKDAGKYYLLLDEVQFMPRFEEVLNSLLRMSNIDVYVTGSNSKFLSSDIVTEFRGRGDEVKIYPLSFAEFYSAYDGDYDDAWEEYMTYGGLPQVAGLKSERQKADYLKNIFANVYLKDVIERNRMPVKAQQSAEAFPPRRFDRPLGLFRFPLPRQLHLRHQLRAHDLQNLLELLPVLAGKALMHPVHDRADIRRADVVVVDVLLRHLKVVFAPVRQALHLADVALLDQAADLVGRVGRGDAHEAREFVDRRAAQRHDRLHAERLNRAQARLPRLEAREDLLIEMQLELGVYRLEPALERVHALVPSE